MSEVSAAEELAALEAEAPDAPEVEVEATEPDGPAPEAEEPADVAARRLGWKPLADWKGDTSGWVDADAYLDRVRNAPQAVSRLEAKFRETEAAQARSLKAVETMLRKQHEAELARVRAEVAQAREAFDMPALERGAVALARLEAAQAPETPAEPQADPVVRGYMESDEGAWLRNPVVRALGAALIDANPQARMMTAADQIAFARESLSVSHPHLVPPRQAPARQPGAAIVDGGTAIPRAKPAKGWDHLPAIEQQFLSEMVRRGDYKNKAEAAAAFWKEYGA